MKRLEQFDVFSMPCSDIFYDEEFNCRGEFTLQSVQELAESIRVDGLKFPIVVQPASDVPGIPAGYTQRIITGHRRYVAVTRLLKWEAIPSRIVAGLTAKAAGLFNLLENLERKDLNPLEEARAIQKQFPHATYREIAGEVHRSTKWVNQRIALIQQPNEIQQLVAAGRLSLNQVWEDIRPIKGVSAKLTAARRLTEHKDLYTRTRNEYRMLTRPRSRKEISAKIAYMLELGLHEQAPILTRFAAWCARGITDDEIDRELAALAPGNQAPK